MEVAGPMPHPQKRFMRPMAILLLSLVAIPANGADPLARNSGKPTPVGNAARPRVDHLNSKLPLAFEANLGQTDSRVEFLSRGQGYTLFLAGDEMVLSLSSRQSAVGRQREMETGNWKLETRNWKLEIRNSVPETRIPKPEPRMYSA